MALILMSKVLWLTFHHFQLQQGHVAGANLIHMLVSLCLTQLSSPHVKNDERVHQKRACKDGAAPAPSTHQQAARAQQLGHSAHVPLSAQGGEEPRKPPAGGDDRVSKRARLGLSYGRRHEHLSFASMALCSSSAYYQCRNTGLPDDAKVDVCFTVQADGVYSNRPQ